VVASYLCQQQASLVRVLAALLQQCPLTCLHGSTAHAVSKHEFAAGAFQSPMRGLHMLLALSVHAGTPSQLNCTYLTTLHVAMQVVHTSLLLGSLPAASTAASSSLFSF
jgi:hypothetical protein